MLSITILTPNHDNPHQHHPQHQRHLAVLSAFDGPSSSTSVPSNLYSQKALFGFNETLPLTTNKLLRADPPQAQTRLRNPRQACRDGVMIVERGGECSFTDKAKRAIVEGGAKVVLIANNDEANPHSVLTMNGTSLPQASSTIPVAMISYASYESILSALTKQQIDPPEVLQVHIDVFRANDLAWLPQEYMGTAMRICALENDYGLLQKLVAREVSLQGKDCTEAGYNEADCDRGATAVGIAVEYECIESLGTLVQCLPLVDQPRHDGYRPLHLAAERDMEVALSMLLSAGAYIDGPHRIGWTALHFAAQKGSLSALRVLLRGEALVDYQACDGSTPLLIAVLYGQTAIVEELLRHGADSLLANKAGNYPLHHLNRQQRGGKQCLELMHKYSDPGHHHELRDGRIAFWLSPSSSSSAPLTIPWIPPKIGRSDDDSQQQQQQEERDNANESMIGQVKRMPMLKAYAPKALVEHLRSIGALVSHDDEGQHHSKQEEDVDKCPCTTFDLMIPLEETENLDIIDWITHAAQPLWSRGGGLSPDLGHRRDLCVITLPSFLRPQLWFKTLVGNGKQGVIPPTVNKSVLHKSRIRSLYEDLARTKFNDYSSGDGLARLQSLILAWLDLNPDHVYRQGLTSTACPFLEVFGDEKEEQALLCLNQMLVLIMDGLFLKGTNIDRVQEKVRHLETLIAYWDPDLAIHSIALDIHAELYCIPWLVTLFSDVMSLPSVIKLWDALITLGPYFFPCFCLAVIVDLRDVLLATETQTSILVTFSRLNSETTITIDLQSCLDRALLFYCKTPTKLLKPWEVRQHQQGERGQQQSSFSSKTREGSEVEGDQQEGEADDEGLVPGLNAMPPSVLQNPPTLSFNDLAELVQAQEMVTVLDVRGTQEAMDNEAVVPIDVNIIRLPYTTFRGQLYYSQTLSTFQQKQMRPPGPVRSLLGKAHISVLAEDQSMAKQIVRMLIISHAPFVSVYEGMTAAD